MNKKLIVAIAVLMIAALTVVAVAYTRGTTSDKAAVSCCCKGDSCPMKSQQTASMGEKASCCDNCDCCKHGEKMATHHAEGMPESCPMNMKAQNASATAEGKKSCDCSCCSGKSATAAPAV